MRFLSVTFAYWVTKCALGLRGTALSAIVTSDAQGMKVGNAMATIEITSENFEQEVMQSDKPVFLDFWAVWCGPCQMVSPLVEELSEEHPEIKFGKINTDKEPQLAQMFGVSSIPMLCIVRAGQVALATVGAQPKDVLEDFISQALSREMPEKPAAPGQGADWSL